MIGRAHDVHSAGLQIRSMAPFGKRNPMTKVLCLRQRLPQSSMVKRLWVEDGFHDHKMQKLLATLDQVQSYDLDKSTNVSIKGVEKQKSTRAMNQTPVGDCEKWMLRCSKFKITCTACAELKGRK